MPRRWMLLACAGLAVALVGAAPRHTLLPDDEEDAGAPDAELAGPDATDRWDASIRDASTAEICDALQARIDRRKSWLAARRLEQFERGPIDLKKNIPNVVQVYCQAHPADEECQLGAAVIEARVEDFLWDPDAGPEDYEAHVVALKRELADCRERLKPRRW